jgi:hypothetical protein
MLYNPLTVEIHIAYNKLQNKLHLSTHTHHRLIQHISTIFYSHFQTS